ncbi:J domain-containing protein [Halorientalis litorea]|uniref:J domain-containing protein n=1 Tax=Halorientalis litorea TaxID=2931977 RepID=UPI001FF3FFC0|nr:J domain-containing protein [Halorientalis litorea]
MHHERLISGIAVALAVSAGVLAVLAVVYNLAILAIALALGAAAYFMWYQASGRLAARVYRSVEQQAADGRSARTRTRRTGGTGGATRETGGFGAGPREDWTPPGGQGRGRRSTRTNGGRQGRQRQRRTAPSTTEGPSEREAYRLLGVEPGADEERVKRAYREKVKEVHPDTEDGDEEEFKRVNRAYERLT